MGRCMFGRLTTTRQIESHAAHVANLPLTTHDSIFSSKPFRCGSCGIPCRQVLDRFPKCWQQSHDLDFARPSTSGQPRCQDNTNFLRASNTAPCNRQCGDGVACLQQHDRKRKVLQAHRNILLELQPWANGQDMHRANLLSCTHQMTWHKRWTTYCTLTIERCASCQNIWRVMQRAEVTQIRAPQQTHL